MALRPLPTLAHNPVYTQGDVASEMYIVLKGELQVTRAPRPSWGSRAPSCGPCVVVFVVLVGPGCEHCLLGGLSIRSEWGLGGTVLCFLGTPILCGTFR
jgi:hypothetical protein